MQLGFVSAIVPELTLDEVGAAAAEAGYACVELMCWPKGKAERRYAGVTHVDVAELDPMQTRDAMARHGVAISALGYYPNPLSADAEEAKACVQHLKRVIAAADRIGVGLVNTFVGRDWTKCVDENWPRFLKTWRPLIKFAEDHGVKVGIENCPMSFTRDEWPGGKNLATSPAIWRRMFSDINSGSFGLNFDPSHFVWQQMDYIRPMREFEAKLFHVHAKDARLDRDRLNQVGLLAHPNEFHTPKLPGLGDVNWSQFFSALTEVYSGAVCVEVEDRAYEGTLENRKRALAQSAAFLRQFIAG